MSLDLRLIAIMAVCFFTGVVIVGLAWFVRGRPRRNAAAWERDAARISAVISEYFQRGNVRVEVNCVSVRGDGRYTVFIESEPMKRFRLSHLIELTLTEHVAANCKLEVDKIYWRFVVREELVAQSLMETGIVSQGGATEPPQGEGKQTAIEQAPVMSAESRDSIEGMDQYKHLPQMEVTELSWEKYQEVSTSQADKRTP
jgi:hypothetical protein